MNYFSWENFLKTFQTQIFQIICIDQILSASFNSLFPYDPQKYKQILKITERHKQMSRDNKVQVKNQQRRLEGKLYTPARAYLNKEKCKKHLPLLDTKVEEWKEKLEVVKVEEESKRFDAEKILEQIEKVHDVIGSIQIQKIPKNEAKIPKAKSTELGKASKPNIEELSIGDKLRGKEFLEKNSFKEGKRKSIGTIQQDKNGMVRIRSSRNVLKVYNPFPASFAEMVQQFD